jgi:hypothetical protein
MRDSCVDDTPRKTGVGIRRFQAAGANAARSASLRANADVCRESLLALLHGYGQERSFS